MFWQAFPDLNLTIEDLVAKGDKVVVRFVARGTHKGEFVGIPATGIKTVAGAIEIVRIEDGMIVEHGEISDMLSIMQQLGMELSRRRLRKNSQSQIILKAPQPR